MITINLYYNNHFFSLLLFLPFTFCQSTLTCCCCCCCVVFRWSSSCSFFSFSLGEQQIRRQWTGRVRGGHWAQAVQGPRRAVGEADGAKLPLQAWHDQALHHFSALLHRFHDQLRNPLQHGSGRRRDGQQQDWNGKFVLLLMEVLGKEVTVPYLLIDGAAQQRQKRQQLLMHFRLISCTHFKVKQREVADNNKLK